MNFKLELRAFMWMIRLKLRSYSRVLVGLDLLRRHPRCIAFHSDPHRFLVLCSLFQNGSCTDHPWCSRLRTGGEFSIVLLECRTISSLPHEWTMPVVVGSIQPDGKERSAEPRAHRRPPGHVVRTGPRNGGRILCRSVSVSRENEAENGLPHPPIPGGNVTGWVSTHPRRCGCHPGTGGGTDVILCGI